MHAKPDYHPEKIIKQIKILRQKTLNLFNHIKNRMERREKIQ
jgi:hypothetical protein